MVQITEEALVRLTDDIVRLVKENKELRNRITELEQLLQKPETQR